MQKKFENGGSVRGFAVSSYDNFLIERNTSNEWQQTKEVSTARMVDMKAVKVNIIYTKGLHTKLIDLF